MYRIILQNVQANLIFSFYLQLDVVHSKMKEFYTPYIVSNGGGFFI